jgi:hypothetical protein
MHFLKLKGGGGGGGGGDDVDRVRLHSVDRVRLHSDSLFQSTGIQDFGRARDDLSPGSALGGGELTGVRVRSLTLLALVSKYHLSWEAKCDS